MPTSRLTVAGDVAGLAMSSTITREAPSHIAHDIPLPAATTGMLTTRTDDDEGVVTLADGHGLVNGDVVGVYWSSGRRWAMVVSNVVGNTMTVSLGAGANLPAQGTALTAQRATVVDTDFDGSLITLLAALCAQDATIELLASGGGDQLVLELFAGQLWYWADAVSVANPLLNKPVVSARMTQGGNSPANVKLGILYDSDG